jgi:hypothetical protein
MMAQSNSQVKNECNRRLQEDLKNVSDKIEENCINNMIKVSYENIYELEFAFRKENFGPREVSNSVNYP